MRKSYAAFSSKVIRGPATAAFTRAFHAGQWVRVAPGHYVAIKDWLQAGFEGRFLMTVAAVLLKDPRRVVCGETALYLLGLECATPREVHIIASSRGRHGLRPAAFKVYGSGPDQERARRLLPPRVRAHCHEGDQVRTYRQDGIAFVGLTHALAEVLLTSEGMIAMAAADAACRFKNVARLTGDRLLKELVQADHRASRRKRAARLIALANALSESVLESFSKWVISCLGFTVPEQQVRLYDDEGEAGRVDYRWRRERITGEADGVSKEIDLDESREQKVARVKYLRRREERLQALGKVVHWGMDDVLHPELFRDKLLRAGVPRDPRRSTPI